MLSSATKKKIDTARDILVGKIPMPTSQVEQITLALIYKFMSDMDKKTKDLGDTSGFFANGYEKYAWDNLMDKALPARDRVLLYRDALEKMALNPHIPQLFRDIFRNASLPFNDPETLKLFLDVIDQFEYDHSEELGNAFEYLLQVMGSQGDAGQFRTPRHIIDFIVEVVDPQKTDTVLDPACGTAGFLISAYKHLRKNGLTNDDMDQISKNFVGYDISQDMQRLSLVNMYLHRFPDPHIYEYDSLSSEDRWNDDFDVILANPPFMTPKGGIRPHNRFSVPSNRAEVLFVDYIMEHLTINGKAGVIVPEGIIFQSQNAYKALRKMMVDNDYLWAVVSLPSGIFQPYSGVKTSVLLFDRQLAKKTNKILFVKVENDGFDLGAQRRASKNDDLPEAITVLKKYKQRLMDGKEIDIEESRTVQLVEKELIRENGYNLSENGYKTSIKKNSSFEVVKLGEVAEIISGQSPDSEFYNDASEGLPFYQGKTEFTNMYIDKPKSWTTQVTKEAVAGDILMSVRAPVGTVNISNQKICIGRGLAAIRVSDKLNNMFLFYLLKANEKYISSLGTGSTFKSINRNQISELEIPLPPLSVQQEIVEELDRYQRIIDGAKQVVDNYQPSFKIEDDWEWVDVGDVCTIRGGYAFKSDDFVSDGVQLIRMGNVKQSFFDKDNKQAYLPESYVEKYPDYVLSQGDILISMTGTVGKDDYGNVCRVDEDKKYLLNQRVAKLEPNSSKIDPDYFYFCTISSFFKKGVLANSSGGVRQANVSASGISKVKIPLPPLSVQKEIANRLTSESKIVQSNTLLIKNFETAIKSKVDGIWGK